MESIPLTIIPYVLSGNYQSRTMKGIVARAGSLLYRRLAVGMAHTFLSVKGFLQSLLDVGCSQRFPFSAFRIPRSAFKGCSVLLGSGRGGA
jgi:hypothetical protein